MNRRKLLAVYFVHQLLKLTWNLVKLKTQWEVRKLKKIAINPVIVELNDTSSDTYMQLDMCILTNAANLNKAQFTDDFIDGVVENKEKYIGIPLVGSRDKLEKGKHKSLTHEYNAKTKQLNTDIIGSFTDFWKEESDGVSKLMGSARVLKRYPNVCEAIKALYDNEELRFSCEVLVHFYGEKIEDGVRTIPYTNGVNVNSLFANCIVTNPAEVRSQATLLIAEAMDKDLGGEGVSDFNKGNEIRFHLETASIKIEQISTQIYNILNPINPRTENRDYNYWIRDLYNDKVVVGDWSNYEYWLINYSIENDLVVLADESQWIEGSIGFIPKSVDINSLLAEKQSLQTELNNKHKEVQKQMKTVEELQAEIDALLPFKEKVETAEKSAKKTALMDRYSKLLSEDVMKTDEVKSAIEELNESKLNEIVVNEAVKQQHSNKGASSKDVVIAATNVDDLIPQDRKTRLYSPKQ